MEMNLLYAYNTCPLFWSFEKSELTTHAVNI